MLEPSEVSMTYRCMQCSHQSLWAFQLDHHILRNHQNAHTDKLFDATVEPEQYPCFCCDFKTNNKLHQYEHSTWNHEDTNNDNGNIKCDFLKEEHPTLLCHYCMFKGHSGLFLLKHHQSCEKMPANPITYVSLPSTPIMDRIDTTVNNAGFRCAQCPYKGKTQSAFRKHLARHSARKEINWISCSKCSFQVKEKRYLKTHMIARHTAHEDIKWFDCTQCSYRAKLQKHLKLHMLTHVAANEIQWFNCTECPYRGKRQTNLKEHMQTHTGTRTRTRPPPDDRFKCAECSFRGGRKADLMRHIVNVHTKAEDINWFSCTQCSYRAKQKGALTSHMLTHATDDQINWFDCTECSYRAKLRSHLRKHSLTHATKADDSVVEWFQCGQCSYRTRRKNYLLKRHMLTHAAVDEINWFKCAKCSFRTKVKCVLKDHMLTHALPEEINWFECVKCSYRGKRKAYLDKHMFRVHSQL